MQRHYLGYKKKDKELGMEVVLIKDGKILGKEKEVRHFSEERPVLFVGIKVKELHI